MRILAIDTALEACSVGLSGAGEPVTVSEVIGRGHAERLAPMIATVMAGAGVAFSQLDRIGVTIGPGSFTGVRIGIAAARGIALVTGCPMVGLGTLAGLAEQARRTAGARPVLAALDARRGEIYGQLFAADGSELGEPRVGDAGMFAAILDGDTLLAGSGADAVAGHFGEGPAARVVHREKFPDMAALLRLAALAPVGGAPRPLYLRPPDAKPQASASVARQ